MEVVEGSENDEPGSPNVVRAVFLARLARLDGQLQSLPEDDWHRYTIPSGQPVLDAAVLVPLVAYDTAVQVLLTQRTSHLQGHAGQISFPGGRVEPEDRDREATALRETEEEIGLPRERVEVLGRLPVYDVQTGYRITPVVGWIVPPYRVQPDPYEVEDVFEVPLGHFLQPQNYQRRSYRLDGQERRYLAIPYAGRYIWGATAAMLYCVHRLLRD